MLFLANRKQADAGPLDLEHLPRIDLAHEPELLQHLRFAIYIRAYVDDNDRSSFVRGEHAGEGRTINARDLAENHLGDSHASAGIASGEEPVRFARRPPAGRRRAWNFPSWHEPL